MTPRVLWNPSKEWKDDTNLSHFMNWLHKSKGLSFSDYQPLWEWSTQQPEEFWESVWQYFDILHDGKYSSVLTGERMPRIDWFQGTQVSYAEHVFRQFNESRPAIIFRSENSSITEISWSKLRNQVASFQQTLIRLGIKKGDVVAAFIPNIPEAAIAFLATNALGATWTSCSPDFGAQSVIDRFAQTNPRVLLASTHYSYGGKSFDKSAVIDQIIERLPELTCAILIGDSTTKQTTVKTVSWQDTIAESATVAFTRVSFEHPIWILYSSGTTGLPKAITHSQGGILLEHLKYLTFHNNVKPGDRCFWYTTTGWMMWNYILSSLLCGGTLVLYDGSPAFPDLNVLWQYAQDARVHHFGTSAGFILSNIKEGLQPKKDFDLSLLKSIGSTGSTLPPEGFDWVYNEVKKDLWLASMSGGTDVCSAFVGGNPTWPVYSGEIQCRALGCSLHAFDESGKVIHDEVGEMVIIKPMPSMPIYFWNDPGFTKYKASYFDMYPSVWRHGDWIRITPRNGVIVYGRSDATLNRGGVRIGTSEIYRAVDKVAEVKDSLIICLERDKGEFFMPLFIQLRPGAALSDELKKKINRIIREDYSPRHVPDEIIAIPDIPYTMSGKKTETPIKKILMGRTREEVISAGSLKNPEALNFFVDYYKNILSKP